jgi:dihydroorotase-like cyclic amidohydrolase
MDDRLLIKNVKIVHPEGSFEGVVGIERGKIRYVGDSGHHFSADNEIDGRGLYLLPGAIDTHIHLGAFGKKHNLPTFEEEIDAFKCAVVGGVTTIGNHLGMGDTACTGSLKPKLKEWIAQINEHALPNFFFHIGIVSDVQVDEIPVYVKDFGVTSFKWYAYSRGEQKTWSMDEITDGDMFVGYKKIASLGDKVLAMRHCENMEVIDKLRNKLKDEDGRQDLRAWYESRPGFVEALDIRKVAYMGKVTGAHIYIVHVSSKEGVEAVQLARKEGIRISAETCIHYLTHNIENSSHFGPLGVESPTLKDPESNEKLWKALSDGTLDCIGTDSGAMTKAHKSNTIWDALAGFSEDTPLFLPVLLSEGVNKGRLSINRVVKLVSQNAAQIHGLWPRKGAILPGFDADLVLVDLEKTQEVTLDKLHYALSDFSLFEGWKLKGWPVMTIINGEIVMREGEITGKPGTGKYLPRSA